MGHPPGSHFEAEMNEVVLHSERMIAVVSHRCFDSDLTRQEWAVAFARDLDGRESRFIPVRVEPIQPGGLFRDLVYVDLVGVDEASARARLLEGVWALPRDRQAL